MKNIIIAVFACLLFSMAFRSFADSTSGAQVLAKVGNEVITVRDFFVLAPMARALSPQGDTKTGKEQLLEALIGQELFAQEAIRLGLDQSPEVQAMLKQARVNILAQAYMQWRRAQGITISDEEINQYFEAHRDDFQGRTLQEAATEIKSKLASTGLNSLLAQVKAELGQRMGVVIDQQLLQEVPLPTPIK